MSDSLLEKRVKEIKQKIAELSHEELLAKLHKGENFKIIDVRGLQDWEIGHLPQAMCCERGVLEIKIEKVVSDPDQEIILYCGGGTRSAFCALSLQEMGYTNVKSLKGGFREWCENNCPIESD